MKKIFLLILLSAAIILPQELRKVVGQSYNSFSGVFFLDENTGWGCGYSESIYKTTDGGVTWTAVRMDTVSATTKTLYSVEFIDANIGFAAGGSSSYALLLKTTDGGLNWTDLNMPAGYNIVGISFTSEQNGWVLTSASDSARIWMTTDGGTSWNSVLAHTPGDLEDIQVRPSGKGVCVGGGVGKLDLYYTSDGITWTKAAAPSLGGFTYTRTDAHGVYMVDDNVIYTCGWGSYIGMQPSIFLKSTDGGATWTFLTQAAENRIYQNMNTLYFKDANNGLAFGGGIYEGTIVARTSDGGTNWIPLESGLGYTAQASAGIGDKVWIVGNGGAVARSDNFADSWQLLTPVIGSTMYDMKIAGNNIFIGGYGGAFFRSTDKGVSWKTGYASIGKVCPTINALSFIDGQTGFAARNNQLVSKTTDGGNTWQKLMPDTSATGIINQGIWFLDENNGYVVGRTGNNADIIYKTTDGGMNWTNTKLIASENMNDVAFYDANNGIAVANDNKVVRTTDAGATWQVVPITGIPAGTDLDIIDVAYSSAQNVIAVGEKCYLISADGGANWEYKEFIPGFPKTMQGVAFKNENEGWAVGDKYIFHTTDGGKNWDNVSDTLVTGAASLYSVAVDNEGYAWFVGGSDVFTYSPFVSVEDSKVQFGFDLSQNYPNPFNPETNISYTIPSESHVVIRVYDILGNLVRELVNTTRSAGTYKISFNAGSLPSGIYFCTMNSGGASFTRKMTLLK